MSWDITPPCWQLFGRAVDERFLKPENRTMALARESPAELLRVRGGVRPVRVEKWRGLDRETR
jgi:hypothetical protein